MITFAHIASQFIAACALLGSSSVPEIQSEGFLIDDRSLGAVAAEAAGVVGAAVAVEGAKLAVMQLMQKLLSLMRVRSIQDAASLLTWTPNCAAGLNAKRLQKWLQLTGLLIYAHSLCSNCVQNHAG